MDRAATGIVEREIGYAALPSQKRFHDSGARFKGFSGPIGSGKSQALCREAIKLAYVNPGRTGLIGAPTFPMLRDATLMALYEALEGLGISHEVNKAENLVRIRETKSRILFRAVEEFERLRGSNLAWFGVDELTYVPEEAWLRLEGWLRDPRATRLCGFGVWTPKGFDWVHERFVATPVAGYETVFAQPFENRYLLEKTPDYYERLRHSYDARFYEQEVLGSYLSMDSGRVYYSFTREANVAAVEVDRRLPLMWTLDFNVDPMASVVAQVCGRTVKVLDEIVLSRARTEQACEEFAARYPGHAAGLVVYADATGARMQTTGLSDVAMVRKCLGGGEYGEVAYKIPLSNPAVRDRVTLMNAKLQSADGDVELVVDPRCGGLVRDFEQVLYKEGSQVVDKERDAKLTHLSDALGYLVWQEFGEGRTVGERGKPLVG
ncbi:MAG TPA: terminase family protein [Bryobacteraceae bacterium]|nr:terminase family protein [Bryobacteraceae bacterium]